MTVKPLSVWLWLLLLIGSGHGGQDGGVTRRSVAFSEEKDSMREEQIQRRLKQQLRQAWWGTPSTLIIPVFKVKEVTMEKALGKLRVWNILTSLEMAPGEHPARFSLDIRNETVAQVLNAIVDAAGNYSWEPYQSSINPVTLVWIVNVFPRGAKEDESNLMNIRVPSLELKEVRPAEVIKRPYEFIRELARRYWELIGGPHGFVRSDVISNDLFLTLKLRDWRADKIPGLEDRTVRDVLNEVSIRSGIGWVYEPQRQGKLPTQLTARRRAQRVSEPLKYGKLPTWRALW